MYSDDFVSFGSHKTEADSEENIFGVFLERLCDKNGGRSSSFKRKVKGDLRRFWGCQDFWGSQSDAAMRRFLFIGVFLSPHHVGMRMT